MANTYVRKASAHRPEDKKIRSARKVFSMRKRRETYLPASLVKGEMPKKFLDKKNFQSLLKKSGSRGGDIKRRGGESAGARFGGKMPRLWEFRERSAVNGARSGQGEGSTDPLPEGGQVPMIFQMVCFREKGLLRCLVGIIPRSSRERKGTGFYPFSKGEEGRSSREKGKV